MNDPIIDEVGCARKKIEAEHDNDWERLIHFLVEKQKTQSLKVATHPPEKLSDCDVA
jgi:hypothetical protein